MPRSNRTKPAAANASPRVPVEMRPRFEAIAALIDEVCGRLLNDEYAQMSRELVAALARKRPSPLLNGRPETWAAAAVHTIGSINFLFDRSFSPYLSAEDLASAFGMATSTVGARVTQIRKLLKLGPFDTRWTVPSMIDRNPFAWLISVNGLPIDARRAPRTVQEEAFRLGLIPYLPEQSAQ